MKKATIFVLLSILSMALCSCSGKNSNSAEPTSENSDGFTKGGNSEIEQLAGKSPMEFFQRVLKKYDSTVKGYTLIMLEQERMGGQLGKVQEIEVKFRARPFSVYMHWLKNPKGASKVLYVKGKYKDSKGVSQMVIEPDGGLAKAIVGGSVLRLPTSHDVMKDSMFPITMFGLRTEITDVIDAMKEADRIKTAKYCYKGNAKADNQECLAFEITGPSKKPFYAPKKIIYMDKKTLWPIRVDYFEKDGQLLARFIFKNIKINPPLTDKEFTPSGEGIKGQGDE